MVTQQEFQDYCTKHGLSFLTWERLDAIFGAEGYEEEIFMAAFYDDPSHGACAAVLKRDARVEVCYAFADGRRRMEDAWHPVTEAEFRSGRCLHAT